MMEEKAKQLLQKYLNGEANAAEIKQVEDWYAQLDNKNSKVTKKRKTVLREKLLGNIQSAISEKQIKKHFFSRYPIVKITAAVLIIISAGFLVGRMKEQPASDASQIVTTTNAGQRKKITLTDGSEITLEPSSKICYPSKFHGKMREIELVEGEAFFTIAHDEKHPFQVQLASDLAVKVLGTSFRIKAYQVSEKVEVLVATGKVAVKQGSKVLGLLTKNQSLLYSKQTKQASQSLTEDTTPVAIEFNGASLREVTQKLEYVYNIEIVLKDQVLSGLKTTATFNSTQKPEDILEILCSLHHIRYSTTKNHKIFKIHQ